MTQPDFRALCAELVEAFEDENTYTQRVELITRARAALATPPPEVPTVMEALAARPLLEQVARLGDCIGAKTVGEVMAISGRAAAWLEANPPGQPVAIEPRGCPLPGACSCVEPATSPPEAPTDEDVAAWVDTPFDNVPDEMPSEDELKEYRCFTEKGLGRTIRAALERWGR